MYMPTPGGLTGAPRRMLTLAKELKRQGVQVCIASDSGSEILAEAAKEGIDCLTIDPVGGLKKRGVNVFRRGGLSRLWLLVLLLLQNVRIFQAVRETRSDVVWLRGSKGILFAGLGSMLARRPVVWDVDYEPPSVGLVRRLHGFGLWLASAVVFQYRRAPDVIFGEGLANQYRQKFSSIIPGIELERLPAGSDRLSEPAGSEARIVILQVGTVCERKNQCFSAKVLAMVKERAPDLQFEWQIAGGLDDKIYLEQLRKVIFTGGLESVTQFLGWRDDLVLLMSSADLLMMPSQDEGVPNTVQEAMYMGTPVLASEAGGMPEVVVHGVTGWVRPLDSPGQWAEELISCLRDTGRTESIRSQALQFSAAQFGTRVWGERYLAVIDNVLSGAGR